MPHTNETQGLQAYHASRTDNPHATTAAQLGLGTLSSVAGTVAGSVSGVANTVLTVGGFSGQTYIVSGDVNSGSPATYSAVAIVTVDGGVLRVTTLQSAALLTISVSGLNIQITQSSGGAQNIIWTVTRVA